MKFAVVFACVVAAASAQFGGRASAFGGFNSGFPRPQASRFAYKPQPSITITPEPAFVPAPAPAVPVAKSYYGGDARAANTVKIGNDVNPDGSFSHFFETDNGIAAQAQGTPRSFGGNPPVVPDVIQGSFSWTSPEGVPVAITYVADENGYQPQGAAIPTPPPVPEAIARALDYIARSAPRQ